jgi:hypothetical protein
MGIEGPVLALMAVWREGKGPLLAFLAADTVTAVFVFCLPLCLSDRAFDNVHVENQKTSF